MYLCFKCETISSFFWALICWKWLFPQNDKSKLKKGRFPYGWFGGSYKNLETSLMGDWRDNFELLNGGTKIGRLDKKLFFTVNKHTASKQQDKFDHFGGWGGKISTVLAENTGDVPFLFDFSTFAFNSKNQKSSGWIGFARRYDERLHRNITLYLACRTWFVEYCVIIIHALSHQED